MNIQGVEFATRCVVIRRVLERHRLWIEQKIGAPLSDAVVLEGVRNFAHAGIGKLLGELDIGVTENAARGCTSAA